MFHFFTNHLLCFVVILLIACARYRFDRGVIHTFPAESDPDQSPYIFDVSFSSSGLVAVSACGPGHLIKLYDRATLTCVGQVFESYFSVEIFLYIALNPSAYSLEVTLTW